MLLLYSCPQGMIAPCLPACPRELAPPFDERFRGWNGDKVSQVSYTAYLKYKFMVLPAIWLVGTLSGGHCCCGHPHRAGGLSIAA